MKTLSDGFFFVVGLTLGALYLAFIMRLSCFITVVIDSSLIFCSFYDFFERRYR